MKAVQAVLFDAGGTLIRVDGERICRAAGVSFEPGDFAGIEARAVAAFRARLLRHPGSRDAERLPLYFDALLEGLGVGAPEERRAALERVSAEHRRANLWSRPGEGAAETLETLRGRGYRMAVVSNSDGRVRALLEAAGLLHWLEFVVDSAEVGVEKPDARIFHAATTRLSLPPGACLYAGDIYEIDVLGARGAGLEAVLVGSGPAPDGVPRVQTLPGLLPLLPESPDRRW